MPPACTVHHGRDIPGPSLTRHPSSTAVDSAHRHRNTLLAFAGRKHIDETSYFSLMADVCKNHSRTRRILLPYLRLLWWAWGCWMLDAEDGVAVMAHRTIERVIQRERRQLTPSRTILPRDMAGLMRRSYNGQSLVRSTVHCAPCTLLVQWQI